MKALHRQSLAAAASLGAESLPPCAAGKDTSRRGGVARGTRPCGNGPFASHRFARRPVLQAQRRQIKGVRPGRRHVLPFKELSASLTAWGCGKQDAYRSRGCRGPMTPFCPNSSPLPGRGAVTGLTRQPHVAARGVWSSAFCPPTVQASGPSHPRLEETPEGRLPLLLGEAR